MHRALFGFLALLAALAVVACGDEEKSSSSSPALSADEEKQAIADTTIDYLSSIVTGDGEAGCAHLVDSAQEEIVSDYNASNLSDFQGGAVESCPEAVESFGQFLAENGDLSEAELVEAVEGSTDPGKVTLTSDTTATISVEQKAGEPPEDYELVKEGDVWKLSASYVTFT